MLNPTLSKHDDIWKLRTFSKCDTNRVTQWIPLNALFPGMFLLFMEEQSFNSVEVLLEAPVPKERVATPGCYTVYPL
jgi:hypothetical protein